MPHNKITKRTILCSLVIVGVIVIPLLYSVFYLGAFWDPYAKLGSLPVAVVNLDQGAQIDGADRNIGQELCNQLKDAGQLKFAFVNLDDALAGTKKNRYYATITIPKDFTASIASANTTEKKVAAITFRANEKRNYLAAQILKSAVEQIKVSLTGKVDREIVTQLCDKLRDTPVQLNVLASGLGTLSDGSGKLTDAVAQLSKGTGTLKNGLDAFSTSLGTYSGGMASLQTGSSDLLDGVTTLDHGIDTLADGANEIDAATTNLDDLRTSAALLASKTDEFNQGLKSYTQGVDSLISSAEQINTFLSNYVAANPRLMDDPAFSQFIASIKNPANAQNIEMLKQYSITLQEASKLITQGTAQLSSSTADLPELRQGIRELSAGLQNAQNGSQQLVNGSAVLKGGINTLWNATTQLNDAGIALAQGAGKADGGAAELLGGTVTLQNGINLAEGNVVSAITDAKTKLAVLDNLNTYAEEPIIVQNNPIDSVPNYGTAFAPYFLSLSLWVGALIIFFAIYLDAEGKFDLLSRNTDKKVLRSFAYLLIGLIQALLLGILLKVVLGLPIEHMLLYYGACCLVSLVFISIVQFLLVFLKDIGKFLSIALLILQLTSCGGTFPMETVPKFFQILYPFMPMTYSVGLLKEAISSTSEADAGFNLVVLGGILIVFMTLTIFLSMARKSRNSRLEADATINMTPTILVSSKGL